LVHVGHATQSRPGVGGGGSQGRSGEAGNPGAWQGAQQPGHRNTAGTGGGQAGNGDRGARSRCNCLRRDGDSRGRSWGRLGMGSVAVQVLEERYERRAGVWVSRATAARSKGLPQRRNHDKTQPTMGSKRGTATAGCWRQSGLRRLEGSRVW
jgi:hypothetical protein